MMRRFLRNNGLSVTLAVAVVLLTVGMSISGFCVHNKELRQHGEPKLTYTAYLASGHFLEGIFENWESEFLQMAAYVLMTAFLVQRGSAESKPPPNEGEDEDDEKVKPDSPWPVKRGGWVLRIYENSLTLALAALFLVSIAGHGWAGMHAYNQQRHWDGEPSVGLGGYMASSQFWYESLQNWQSEFLAVLAIVMLSIWLRQKNSPESKEVTAPNWKTGR